MKWNAVLAVVNITTIIMIINDVDYYKIFDIHIVMASKNCNAGAVHAAHT